MSFTTFFAASICRRKALTVASPLADIVFTFRYLLSAKLKGWLHCCRSRPLAICVQTSSYSDGRVFLLNLFSGTRYEAVI